MNRHPPYCVFIAYNEEKQQTETFTVNRETVKKLKQAKLVMRWPLEQHPLLDDEFARKLGRGALSLLALGQPELAPFITVTKDPS